MEVHVLHPEELQRPNLAQGPSIFSSALREVQRHLRAAGEEAAQLVLSPSWAGYKLEGGAFWHLPFCSMSWTRSASPALLNREAAQAIPMQVQNEHSFPY